MQRRRKWNQMQENMHYVRTTSQREAVVSNDIPWLSAFQPVSYDYLEFSDESFELREIIIR